MRLAAARQNCAYAHSASHKLPYRPALSDLQDLDLEEQVSAWWDLEARVATFAITILPRNCDLGPLAQLEATTKQQQVIADRDVS